MEAKRILGIAKQLLEECDLLREQNDNLLQSLNDADKRTEEYKISYRSLRQKVTAFLLLRAIYGEDILDKANEALKEVFATLTLTPREQRVLQLRFGLEDGRIRTLEQVGKEFGITRERIRQIEDKALRKLRHPDNRKKFILSNLAIK